MKYSVNVDKGIQYIKITNKLGLEVVFSSLGATIASITLDGVPMTMSPKNLSDLKKPNIYHGKTIGQIANRVKDGKVIINNKEYQLDTNEGNNTLHGGINGLSNKVFDTKREITESKCILYYSLNKKDKQYSLPGNINYLVAYSISDDDNYLRVDFRARSDKDTLVALTNHSFFCLGASTIDELSLEIQSDKFLEVDDKTLLPLKEKEMIPCLDFKTKRKITQLIDNEYLVKSKTNGIDHHFILNGKKPIKLESKTHILEIESDFSGIQVYSDNYEDNVTMSNTDKKRRRGVALEPQDSTLDRKILKANEMYSRFIIYKFSAK